MDSLYKSSILARLNDVVEKNMSEQKFNVLLPKGAELIKLLATGNLSILPLISLSNEYEYIIEDDMATYQTLDNINEIHSNEYNYSEAIPARLYPCFTLIATDISHIIEMEKIILDNFSSVQQLTIEHPNKQDEMILFDISINSSKAIERQNKELNLPNLGKFTLYQSIIRLKCENCAMFLPKFHAIQIQLDKNTQLQLTKRGRALEALQKKAQECNSEQILLAHSEIIKLLDLNTFEDYGFTELYQKMIDLKSDVSTANKACMKDAANKKTQMLQEQARIEAVNKEYSKKGDEVLNIYTDAIVEDIRSRVADKLNIPVYGGSTYVEWFRLYSIKELKLPNILVTALPEFTLNYCSSSFYTLIDKDGNKITRPFLKDKLPINYRFSVGILAKNEADVEIYKKALIDAYSEKIQIDIMIPPLNDNIFPMTIQYDASNIFNLQTLNDSLFGNVYKGLLCFDCAQIVYCVKEYTKEEIENNQRLQFRLLQQALYMLVCLEALRHSTYKLDRDYKSLITRKNSVLGFFKNEEYKKLKFQFDSGTPIDKELFNSVLKDITRYFPSLYDRMLLGWTYEQISEYIQGYVHFFEERHKNICDTLGIPMKFFGLSYPSPRSKDALRAYIQSMELPVCSLNKALMDFRNYEIQRRAQQDAEDAARREARRESGNSSFLGGVLKTAAGVAIGNSISNRRNTSKQHSGKSYYTCPISCKFGYRENGVPRCRLSTNWLNSPEPEKCGYGHRIR